MYHFYIYHGNNSLEIFLQLILAPRNEAFFVRCDRILKTKKLYFRVNERNE